MLFGIIGLMSRIDIEIEVEVDHVVISVQVYHTVLTSIRRVQTLIHKLAVLTPIRSGCFKSRLQMVFKGIFELEWRHTVLFE